MSDSTQHLPTAPVNSTQLAVWFNGLADAMSLSATFGRNWQTTTGLTWGILRGRWNGTSLANTTVSLTNNATNYVVADRSTGACSVSTATTNWDNTASYIRLHKVVTSGGSVTSYEDHRTGSGGLFSPGGAASSTIGRHAMWISAASCKPTASAGCAELNTVASGSNLPDITYLAFDASTAEHAQVWVRMPKSWNKGTLTFVPVWSHAATATNFGVCWKLKAVAISNDDTIGASFGTAQSSVDTGGTTDDMYAGPESSAMTVAGTPQDEDMLCFDISRDPSDGGDTMAIDARLHGFTVYMTTAAETDA